MLTTASPSFAGLCLFPPLSRPHGVSRPRHLRSPDPQIGIRRRMRSQRTSAARDGPEIASASRARRRVPEWHRSKPGSPGSSPRPPRRNDLASRPQRDHTSSLGGLTRFVCPAAISWSFFPFGSPAILPPAPGPRERQRRSEWAASRNLSAFAFCHDGSTTRRFVRFLAVGYDDSNHWHSLRTTPHARRIVRHAGSHHLELGRWRAAVQRSSSFTAFAQRAIRIWLAGIDICDGRDCDCCLCRAQGRRCASDGVLVV